MTRFYQVETSVLYGSVWFLPYDEFTRRPLSAGVSVALDRWDTEENVWLPEDTLPVRTPSAAIAYPTLGRRGGPSAVSRRYRVRFTASGYAPMYPADGEPFDAGLTGVEFATSPYDDTSPPAALAEPRVVRLLPGTTFPYPPFVRTVHGVVVSAGTPVPNALVSAAGTTTPDATAWLERTLTDARGNFRLSLRWQGAPVPADPESQSFTVTATDRPGRTGSLAVRLPADRDRRLVIEIVQQ